MMTIDGMSSYGMGEAVSSDGIITEILTLWILTLLIKDKLYIFFQL